MRHFLLLLLLFGLSGPGVRAQEPPGAPFERYALRAWQDTDLLALLSDGIARLTADEPGAQDIVRLTLFELSQRFPDAPRDPAQRAALLTQMLAAPRGSVDMRSMIRPYVLTLLNTRFPDFSLTATLGTATILVETYPAEVNGDAQPEAMLHTVASTASGEILYEDYTLANFDVEGQYQLFSAVPPFPAAPFGASASLMLERLGDANGDTVDELVLLVNRPAAANPIEMLIYGARGGQVINQAQSGSRIQFGRLLSWPQGTQTITVMAYRLESPAWGCLGEQPVSWTWNANAFRPSAINANAYVQQDSLACALLQAEPLFVLPPAEAINTVQNIIARYPFGDAGSSRAAMVLAMLYELDGQRQVAIDQVEQLQGLAMGDEWLIMQTSAFLAAAAEANATSLDICAAVQLASPYGACDVDGVLERLFTENPPRRDIPLVDQLNGLGFRVLQTVEFVEAGRAPRIAVNFDIAGASWWAFAPLTREFYAAERLPNAPAGFEEAALPPSQIVPPDSIYELLLDRGDLIGTLALLDNLRRATSDVPLAPEGLYIQALVYDLLGDRTNARQAYFDLWSAYPATVWGQFAAAHLEQR
ncbi:MAG: hypothetical protein HXY40_02000 [Chloroflexi bacterium]|nr:hypothetical protein [Chloroflexota bacterium]